MAGRAFLLLLRILASAEAASEQEASGSSLQTVPRPALILHPQLVRLVLDRRNSGAVRNSVRPAPVIAYSGGPGCGGGPFVSTPRPCWSMLCSEELDLHW